MKKTLSIILTTTLLVSGCVSVPVVAKSDKGEKFVGSATATLVSGTFEATSPSTGTVCWGTYNQWDYSPTLSVAFKTSDGRWGTGIIARDASGTSGIGTGMANDGTKFDFWMGNAIAWHVRSSW
jgi:hypothetical protein